MKKAHCTVTLHFPTVQGAIEVCSLTHSLSLSLSLKTNKQTEVTKFAMAFQTAPYVPNWIQKDTSSNNSRSTTSEQRIVVTDGHGNNALCSIALL